MMTKRTFQLCRKEDISTLGLHSGSATPVQSDTILLQTWGLRDQLAIQAGSGSSFSETGAQHIKETDNKDRH